MYYQSVYYSIGKDIFYIQQIIYLNYYPRSFLMILLFLYCKNKQDIINDNCKYSLKSGSRIVQKSSKRNQPLTNHNN
ncbi:hypothetical protein FGO68_gene15012 [Halteria grandinella]|uniref:Uncharacterized protein n=1 Tax=Halteria grandinella TaxID=5974 RepID=A0A8J8NIM6_HALGN|nr:hypothetical protein FGO68_gene15012 [Halteria grandinella]